MVKRLQSLAISLPLCVLVITVISVVTRTLPSRSALIWKFLIPPLLLFVLGLFGYAFFVASKQLVPGPAHPITRAVVALAAAVVSLLACLSAGIWLAGLLHYHIASQ